jgi:hypothetical protein
MSSRENDPHAIVQQWGKLAAEVSPLAAPILLLVRSAASTEPALAAVLVEADEQRRARMRHNARKLANRGFLRKGVSVSHAAEVMSALVAPELYELLVVRSRWTPRRFGQFVADVMAATLLPSR